MGFLKLLLNANNAEGIREAMRASYRGYLRHARRGKIKSDFDPHTTAMLGALGSRMAVNAQAVTPGNLWQEVAPFLLIKDPEVAVEALAEYAVYVERTIDTKLVGLRETLNSWLRRTPDGHDLLRIVAAPAATRCRWHDLLDFDVSERLDQIRVSLPLAQPPVDRSFRSAEMPEDQLVILDLLTWGADKSAARQWFRGWMPLPPHPTQNAIGFQGELMGVPAAAVCYFRKALFRDKLAQVNIVWWGERPADDIVEAMFGRVRDELERRLGRAPESMDMSPSDPQEFRQSAMLYWPGNDRSHVLSCALLRDGVSPTKPPLGLMVSDPAHDPLRRGV